MNTSKAAGIAAGPATSGSEKSGPAGAQSAGWDPIEVWRTRVLLPRLEQKALANRQPDNGTSSKIVVLRSV
jgi:hypothetical protein